jgi:hypothetical protein
MDPDDERAIHRRTWEAIPWIVNKRMPEAERSLFEEHLRGCRDCREELALQRRVCQEIRREDEPMPDPGRGLERLWQRIDAESAMTAPVAGTGQRVWVRWLAAAAIVEAVALSAMIGAGLQDGLPQYRTLSNSVAHPPEAIRAVFDPQLPLTDLQAVLDAAKLRIVDGPSAAGVYTLAPRPGTPRHAALAILKKDDRVRFAEPAADAAPAP